VGIRVARATRSTGFVVALQTYVLHTLGVLMVLQSLVVALSMTRKERQTVASERSLDVPSVCVRFTLQG
jgi:hypothetical protein